MKKWDPIKVKEGNVILAFKLMLTPDAIVQLGNRVIRQCNSRWMSRTSVSPRPAAGISFSPRWPQTRLLWASKE